MIWVYQTGLAAMNTTLQAGWSVSDAMRLGTPATSLHIHHKIFPFWVGI